MPSFFGTVDKINSLLKSVPPEMKKYAVAFAFGSAIGYQEYRLRQTAKDLRSENAYEKALLRHENCLLRTRIENLERENQAHKNLVMEVEVAIKDHSRRLDKVESHFEKYLPVFKELKRLGTVLVPGPQIQTLPNITVVCKDSLATPSPPPKEAVTELKREDPPESDPKAGQQTMFLEGLADCKGATGLFDYLQKFLSLFARADKKKEDEDDTTKDEDDKSVVD